MEAWSILENLHAGHPKLLKCCSRGLPLPVKQGSREEMESLSLPCCKLSHSAENRNGDSLQDTCGGAAGEEKGGFARRNIQIVHLHGRDSPMYSSMTVDEHKSALIHNGE